MQLSDSLPAAQRPTLLIPHIVLRELDGLKGSQKQADPTANSSRHNRMTASISTLARAATNWLLEAIPSSSSETSVVRGQRKSETLLPEHIARKGGGGENNDSLVLDAASYFVANESKRVVLLSDDNNLRLRAKFEHVEAMSIDSKIGNDARKLLETLDPALVTATTPESPRMRPSRARRPSSRRSSQAETTPTSPKSSATPIPLPSTLVRSDSMELEVSSTVPLVSSPHAPTLLPPKTASSIFANVLILFAHFLALPLYKAVYSHFNCGPDVSTERQRVVLEELGDWREWDAARCAEVIKQYWLDGGVRDLCEKGFDKIHHICPSPAPPPPEDPAPPPPPPPPAPAPRDPVPPPQRQSRWAPAAPASPPLKSPKPATVSIAPSPVPPRARPVPSPSVALSTLHSALPALVSTFGLPASAVSKWSSIRFEVLLENVGNWLCVLLSGAFNSNVREVVEPVVKDWEGQLKKIGVNVDPIKLGVY